MESPHERALRDIEEIFEDRLKRGGPAPPGVPDAGDALASVSPMSAEEVKLLAEVDGRYSVPLVALGAGMATKPDPEGGSILIHFDLMRDLRLPEHEESWVEAEPGTSWLQLDDFLRARGWGLAVYPSSAPLATVGGWLAMDGLGVGSFEYGWLRENVLWVSVVLPPSP
jgi:FAD/FMN-containing dehydrogenase